MIGKITKKAICITLALCLILNISIPTFAQKSSTKGKSSFSTILTMKDKKGKVRIDYKLCNNGDKIFKQYINNVLTDQNVIKASSPNEVIKTEYTNRYSTCSNIKSNSISKKSKFKISDYVTFNPPTNQYTTSSASSPRINLGTIRYRSIGNNYKTIKYGLKVSYTTTYYKNSSYTIKTRAGKLVDLITIVAGGISLPEAIAASFIKRVLVCAGISIVGGNLSKALSTTVAAQETRYNMRLVNTTCKDHKKTVYGYKYYVTDSKYHYGETYFDGYLPQKWGSQALGVQLHNEMFGYSTFDILKWE